MASVVHLLPFVFGAGSIVTSSSFIFPDVFGIDKEIVLKVTGSSLSSSGGNKKWIKLGNQTVGEGIFVQTQGTYTVGGYGGGDYFGPARVGSSTSSTAELAEDNKTVMIVAGSKGVVIFRGKRHFKNSRRQEDLESAKKILSDVWNKGESSSIVDEDTDYYCKERTDQWKKWAEVGTTDGDIGYVKQLKAHGPLATITLIDNKKLKQHIMKTNCRGTEMFFPEKVSFFGSNPTENKEERIEVVINGKDKSKIGTGYKFKLGNIEAVLYGRNKDLRITKKGIEDGIGNRISWGKSFLPADIRLELVQ